MYLGMEPPATCRYLKEDGVASVCMISNYFPKLKLHELHVKTDLPQKR